MKNTLLLLCAMWCASPGASTQTLEIAVPLKGKEDMERLQCGSFDVIRMTPEPRVFGDAESLSRLRAMGFAARVVSWNVEQDYASRLQTASRWVGTPPFGQGSMGGYYTHQEVVAAMDELRALHPNLVAPKVSLGLTLEGRDIWMWKISDNPQVSENEPAVVIDGGHHGREPITVQACVWFAKRLCEGHGVDPELTSLVDHRELYIVPLVNVDGFVHNEATHPGGGGVWRKNRRINSDGSVGVDPNRNYAFQWGLDEVGSSATPSSPYYRGTAPFSEPCAAAIKGLSTSLGARLAGYFTLHAFGSYVFIPPGYAFGATASSAVQPIYDTFASELAHLSPQYATGHSYSLLGQPANGTSLDWHYGAVNGGESVWSFAAELGSLTDGFWPSTSRIIPICEDAFAFLKHVTRITGPDPRILDFDVIDSGQSNGSWDPGEVLDVSATVSNGGVSPDTFELRIESTNPWVQVLGGPVSVGVVAAHGGTASNGSPMQVQINAATPVGAEVTFDIVVEGPLGAPSRVTVSQPAGLEAAPTLFEDFESGQGGWTVHNEISSAGDWVLAAPTGTTFANQLWNPDHDHTPAPGTHCWVTGDLGGSPGNHATHDVDGITTLISPLLDASHLFRPRLTYWRWFAVSNLGSGFLEVSLSNDGGDTWKPMEVVTLNQPQWVEVTHVLEDHLPRTSAMRIRFRAVDWPSLDILEVAIDDLSLHGFEPPMDLTVTGSPMAGSTSTVQVTAPHHPHATYLLGVARSALQGVSTGIGVVPLDEDDLFGMVPLFPSVFQDFYGVLDHQGSASAQLVIPNTPVVSGWSFIISGVTVDATPAATSIAGGVRYVIP